MALVDRINSGLAELRHRDGQLSLNDWADYFSFGGNTYPFVQTTMGQVDRESVGVTSIAGFKSSGPVFSLVLARLQAFSQVRFQWTRFQGSQPTDLFGSPELAVLERPWNGGTTSDLLARMEVHASVAGCAYVTRPRPDRLSMLRPDRVTIVMGSQTDADDPSEAPDVEIVGFLHTTSRGKMTAFGPNEVAYYAPIPDPDYRFLGMSWITPVLRDLLADSLATEHKARFFVNSATPNLAIKFDASVGIEKVKQFKALLESEHKGAFNAWKTLYLGGGADPVPVGSSFRDMDYAVIQGRAESRLAAAAGVPPSWVGFAEGLQGSSLNAGNFNSARRRFSDGTMVHLWTNAATSLEVLLSRPQGATLWYDPRVPFMREDAQDLAGIQQNQAATIVSLSTGGFTRESAIAAVTKNDFNLLVKDPNWVSVQLQQSGGGAPPAVPDGKPSAVNGGPKVPAAKAARAWEPAAQLRNFNPDEPRGPDGKWVGGGGVIKKLAHALTGQHALDATPAKLTPGPSGHSGDYTGEKLTGPRGMGSVRALSEYEGVEYIDTNIYLRNGPRITHEKDLDPSSPFHGLSEQSNRENAHRVSEIDKTMAVSRLTADVQVHRIVKDGSTVFGRDTWFGHVIDWNTNDFDEQDRQVERWIAGERPDLAGLEWREEAYSSTTVDPKIVEAYAQRFDRTRGDVSGGTVILNIHVPKGTGGVQMSGIGDRQEAEILLQRGLRMRVVKDHGEDANGRRILDIEVIRGD